VAVEPETKRGTSGRRRKAPLDPIQPGPSLICLISNQPGRWIRSDGAVISRVWLVERMTSGWLVLVLG